VTSAGYREARERWPDIELGEAEFATYAGTGEELNAPDLYLALACGKGNAGALAVLEREYLSTLPAALKRICNGGSSVDEVLQAVREELLVARPDAPPRIVNYAGRGPLRSWLRSVAVRTAMRLNRVAPHQVLDEQDAAGAGDDLELAFMKKTYGEAFRRAFQSALAGLPEDKRLLLKQRYRHQMTVEQLGAMHAVNPGTISRWVAAAREQLVGGTRAAMMTELGVGGSDVESILRMIHSQIELSLSTQGDLVPK
jgi:RNA polymerase sigma-70 factor (ECF subfamily)